MIEFVVVCSLNQYFCYHFCSNYSLYHLSSLSSTTHFLWLQWRAELARFSIFFGNFLQSLQIFVCSSTWWTWKRVLICWIRGWWLVFEAEIFWSLLSTFWNILLEVLYQLMIFNLFLFFLNMDRCRVWEVW